MSEAANTCQPESLLKARSHGRPQMPYGFVGRSDWGQGDGKAKYAVGDVVYVPADSLAATSGRCPAGLHRVESCFSISEEAEFYYRLCPAQIVGEKGSIRIVTDWNDCSDRLHDALNVDYTDGWIRLYCAEKAV